MINEAELKSTQIKLEAIAKKLGLKPTSIREEIVLAKFIEGKLLKAAKLFLRSVRFDQSKRSYSYLDCLHSIWKMGFVGDGFIEFEIDDLLIQEVYPELCKTIIVDSQCSAHLKGWVEHSSNGSYSEMTLCVNSLESSITKSEFQKNLQQLISTVYHECDHLTFSALKIYQQDIESRTRYMTDPAEIRAFSKQLASLYYRIFPGKKFNYKTLKRYILLRYGLKDQEFQIIQYLDFFKNPRNPPFTRKENIEFAYAIAEGRNEDFTKKTLQKAFKEYLVYITYFVNYFNQRKVDKSVRSEQMFPRSLKGAL